MGEAEGLLDQGGTTIFVASILMWLLLNFGPGGYTTGMADSFGALLGKWLVPFFAPIGLGFWQIAVALIAGVSAKEVVVSSTAVLFGIANVNSPGGMGELGAALTSLGFGPLNAYCLMVFCLLYVPCVATLATIHKESKSWKWTGPDNFVPNCHSVGDHPPGIPDWSVAVRRKIGW